MSKSFVAPSAEAVAKSFGGATRSGNGYLCRCPVHRDHNPSLSVADGDKGLLVHCFSGCNPTHILAYLRSRYDSLPADLTRQQMPRPSRKPDEERLRKALWWWSSSEAAQGTIVRTYLESRAINSLKLPESLRFHDGQFRGGNDFPSMIALVTCGQTGQPLGIHRTRLRHDGGGKAPLESTKTMHGPVGGGAVRLSEENHSDGPLLVGEGIESTSSMAETILPFAPRTRIWAALSATNLSRLTLPAGTGELWIAADNDANRTGQIHAEKLADHATRAGWQVKIRMPENTGDDFNDESQRLKFDKREQIN